MVFSTIPGGFGLVSLGMVWFGMVWYGMVWIGLVWYGIMFWYGLVRFSNCFGTIPGGWVVGWVAGPTKNKTN